jgi:signal transduction histidine kinase/CheY-like chemotaxis protein
MFRGKLIYDPISLAVLSANEDACAFFDCPSADLVGQCITDLPWPEASEQGTYAEGRNSGTGIGERFGAKSYWQTTWLLKRSPAGHGLSLCIEVEPLELGDRTLMLVSLRLEVQRATPRLNTRPESILSRSVTENVTDKEQSAIARVARCLLWYADVSDVAGKRLDWDIHVVSEEAANQFLPLRMAPHYDYATALYFSRLPEDSKRMSGAAQAYVRANQSYSQEYRVRTRDGAIRWLKEDVNIEPVAPGKWRAVGVCTDITERKQAEEAQNYIMRSARCLIWQAKVRKGEDDLLEWETAASSEEAAQAFLPLDVPPETEYWWAVALNRLEEDEERINRYGRQMILANKDYSQEFRVRNKYGEIRWLREDVHVAPLGQDQWHCVGVCTDITDLKQAEAEREQLLAGLRYVAGSARCFLWHAEITELGAEAGLKWQVAAPAAENAPRLFPVAMRPDQDFFTAWYDSRLPEDRLATDAEADAQIRAGQNFNREFRYIAADGQIRWAGEDIAITIVEPGRVWHAVGVCVDITERKQAQLEWEASQRQLCQVMEQANCLLWQAEVREELPYAAWQTRVFDPVAGTTLIWDLNLVNENEVLRWLPLDRQERESMAAAWHRCRHPDDRQPCAERSWSCLAAGVDSYTQTYRMIVQGNVRWFQEDVRIQKLEEATTLSGLDGQTGDPRRRWRLTGVVTDITDLKRAQEAQQHVTRAARCLIWYGEVIGDPDYPTELDWQLRALSDEIAEDFLPLDVREGSNYLLAMTESRLEEDSRRIFTPSLNALLADSNYSQEFRVQDKHGKIWWLHEDVSVERVERGKWRLVGVCTDVTRLKQAEEAQLRSQKLEALGTLSGGIAHDFNNILSAIIGNTQLAAMDLPPDHPVQESLDAIMKASSRSADLIRQILTFSRPHDQHRKCLSLRPVVQEALTLLRATLPTTIEIQTVVSPEAPSVIADSTQIHQVIVNLATNAAHAIGNVSTPGVRSGHIAIRLDSVDVTDNLIGEQTASGANLTPGRYARLSVSDNGCGMDRETLARIFDPFFTTKAAGEGTGLGLSVVHGIMKSHGGAVTVYSHPGAGSVFRLYFPAAESVVETGTVAPDSVLQTGDKHILYVDDEEALVILAQRALQRLGYTVTGSTDPQEALALFQAQPQEYHLVITDLYMPGMSGFELVRQLLATRPDTAVVMTSGYIRPEEEEEARQLGIEAVVQKPFNLAELARVVDGISCSITGAAKK